MNSFDCSWYFLSLVNKCVPLLIKSLWFCLFWKTIIHSAAMLTSLWARHGSHSSGFSCGKIFVAHWLAETALADWLIYHSLLFLLVTWLSYNACIQILYFALCLIFVCVCKSLLHLWFYNLYYSVIRFHQKAIFEHFHIFYLFLKQCSYKLCIIWKWQNCRWHIYIFKLLMIFFHVKLPTVDRSTWGWFFWCHKQSEIWSTHCGETSLGAWCYLILSYCHHLSTWKLPQSMLQDLLFSY